MTRAPRAGSDHPTLLDPPADSGTLPRTLAPMRPRLADGGFNSPDHLFELKWDGIRALVSTDRTGLRVVAEYELEGGVAKRRDGKYIPGTRSADWLKCLVSPRADVVIGGLVLDERRGARALLCGWMNDNGALTYAGEAYVPPYLGEWVDVATREFRTDGSPFLGPFPLRPGMVWLRPKLVAIVDHEDIERGVLVDARFRALRFDARLDDCRIEEPVEVPEFPPTGGPDRPRLVVLPRLPFRFE